MIRSVKFILVLQFILLVGCSTRDSYLGTYDTNVVENCWGASSPCNINSGGLEVIVVKTGNANNSVIVLGKEVVIDEHGYGSIGGTSVYGLEVLFKSDIISITERWGGAVGGITRTYTGGKN